MHVSCLYAALGALLGACAVLYAPLLLPYYAIYIAIFCALMCVSLLLLSSVRAQSHWFFAVACCCLAYSYTHVTVQTRLDSRLPHQCGRTDMLVTATVEHAIRDENFYALDLRLDAIQQSTCPQAAPEQVAVRWYIPRGKTDFTVDIGRGDVWDIHLRLFPNHGLRNAHTFSYERYLFQHAIDARGYVRHADSARRITEGHGVGAWFEDIQERSINALLPYAPSGIPIAIMTGDARAISPMTWRRLNQYNLTHLVVISGMHLGMVFVLLTALFSVALKRIPAHCAAYTRIWLIVVAWCLTALFAYFTGLQVPAQRALIMLSFVTVWLCANRQVSALNAWSAALITVLLFDPTAPLSIGFWLSFGLVLLLLSMWRADVVVWWQLIIVQCTIFILLVPFSLYNQGGISPLAPVFNLVAMGVLQFALLPVLLCVVPLLLWMVPDVGQLVLSTIDQSIQGAFDGLAVVSQWSLGFITTASPTLLSALLVTVSLLWWVLALPYRWCAFLALAPLLLVQREPLGFGEFRLVVFDVGQATAQLVHTAQYALVVDTGRRSARLDAGRDIILTYLRGEHITPDAMLISSHDADHTGGAQAISHDIPQIQIIANGSPVDGITDIVPCVQGKSWQRDGVTFEIIHPDTEALAWRMRNNRSCVLRVTSQYGSVLLPADIEKRAERYLLAGEYEDVLATDVLIVPHHGSKSSSTEAFIRSVSPQHLVFSSGYLNRYKHPHPDVVARYQTIAHNSVQYFTHRDGALTFSFTTQGIAVTRRTEQLWQQWLYTKTP